MAGGLCCSLCTQTFPRSSFSRGQLKKDERRQCLKCVALLARLRELSEEIPKKNAACVIADCQVIEFVLGALRTYPNHKDIQMDGLVALAHKCCDQAGGRTMAWEQGALTVVLSAMDACPGQSAVAARALLAVGNLCDSLDHSNIAFEAGALMQILSCMRMYPSEEEVQRFGASALANVCFELPAARSAALENGAVPLLVDSLESWQNSEHVIVNTLHAFAALGSAPESASFAKSVPHLIAVAMETHAEMPQIQCNGLEAIGNLCDVSAELRHEALLAGTALLAQRALLRWGTSHEGVAQAAVCGTLEGLTRDPAIEEDPIVAEVLVSTVAVAERAAAHFAGNEALVREAKRLRDRADDPTALLKRLRI